MSENTDETTLLDAAREGDPEALTSLISRYSPRIYRFGMKMCRDEEDAKEVVQDTLLAVAKGVREFRGDSSLSTWLYTIARSFCIKRRRRSVGEPDALESIHDLRAEGTPELVEGRGPEERAAARQVEVALEQAIDALDPMYREVLILRDVEGLTAPEVSKVLGISVEAVKSRLHRARASVRERLAPLFAPEAEAPAGATCPDVVELLSRHLEDDVSAEVCREMEEHVASCPRCAARCDSLRNVLALCQAPVPNVPPEVQAKVRVQMRAILDELAPKKG